MSLTSSQSNNYTTLVLLTAVGYDCTLTFSDEIKYIWKKPWTRVSTLYVLARYSALSFVIVFALLASTFLPGSENVSTTLEYLGASTLLIFMGAADLVMILRVWALYNRSRFILAGLLALCAANIIAYILLGINISINDPGVSSVQMHDLSVCLLHFGAPIWPVIIDVIQITLGASMSLLVVAQFVRQSLDMYRATRQFQLNRYVNLLLREGLMYFLSILTLSIINGVVFSGDVSTLQWWPLLLIPEYIFPFTLVPRFILSLRALYANDLRGRHGESDIDTAFGSRSSSGRGATSRSEGLAGEEIPMEWRDGRRTGSTMIG